MSCPVPLAVLVSLALALAAGCGPSSPAEARMAEVTEILVAHVEHEEALLDILERHEDDPVAAETALKAYLAEHGAEMSELAAKRRLLEAEPTALAGAMRLLEPEMTRVFERRRSLDETHPELMTREEVRTALAKLDPL